jgi:hypothetical protein
MDMDALVNEIIKRVKEKITAFEPDRPKLLILNGDHGSNCHPLLENTQLNESYLTECALQKEYDCQVDDYEAVIVYSLSNANLGKVANGMFLDGYSRIFGEALLAGKKIYLPAEEIELYLSKNKQTPYYQRLLLNLQLLTDSGVEIVAGSELVERILGQTTQPPMLSEQPMTVTHADSKVAAAEKEVYLSKRVITEKDIVKAGSEKAKIIVIDEKALITDLAKEYAAKRKITIKRKGQQQ